MAIIPSIDTPRLQPLNTFVSWSRTQRGSTGFDPSSLDYGDGVLASVALCLAEDSKYIQIYSNYLTQGVLIVLHEILFY